MQSSMTSEEALETTEKEGLDTGLRVNHPFIEGKKLPVFIANFILMDYGTGAIFGCPAHDQRDLEFAKKYNLEILQVFVPENLDLQPKDNIDAAILGEGKMINSDFLDGLNTIDARKLVCDKLMNLSIGEKINYRLRDWGIPRQRYWGCPIHDSLQ